MLVPSSLVQPEPIAVAEEAVAKALARLLSPGAHPLALRTRWLMHHRPRWSDIGHSWSAEDVMMVIVWVLMMPYAAARFERDIISPPLAHLPAASTFFVASAAALAELAVAAVAARMATATMRQAVRRVIRRAGPHRDVRGGPTKRGIMLGPWSASGSPARGRSAVRTPVDRPGPLGLVMKES
jgi:hypothetical protein